MIYSVRKVTRLSFRELVSLHMELEFVAKDLELSSDNDEKRSMTK